MSSGKLSGQWLDYLKGASTCNQVMIIKRNVHLIALSKVFFFILSYCFSLLYMMSYKEDICLQLSFERRLWGQFHLTGMKSSSKFCWSLFSYGLYHSQQLVFDVLTIALGLKADDHHHNTKTSPRSLKLGDHFEGTHNREAKEWAVGLQISSLSTKQHFFYIISPVCSIFCWVFTACKSPTGYAYM